MNMSDVYRKMFNFYVNSVLILFILKAVEGLQSNLMFSVLKSTKLNFNPLSTVSIQMASKTEGNFYSCVAKVTEMIFSSKSRCEFLFLEIKKDLIVLPILLFEYDIFSCSCVHLIAQL